MEEGVFQTFDRKFTFHDCFIYLSITRVEAHPTQACCISKSHCSDSAFSTFQGIWLTQWTVFQTTARFKQSFNDIVLISAALFNSGKHKTALSWVRPSSCDGSQKMGSSRLVLSTRWALDDEKGFNLWPDITESEHAQTLFTGLHVDLLKTCKCISAEDLDRTICLSSRTVP